MKVYTIKDIESFERDELGRLICPSGDYSQIHTFGEYCSFGVGCSFGMGCSFGKCCIFGERCSFCEYCSFGMGCSFGKCCIFGERCSFCEYCSFGKCCRFGERCSFGKCCTFGECCIFGERCSFGVGCSFGEDCNLDNNLKFENIEEQVDRVLKIDRIGSRRGCTYFFKTPSKIYVRCGCFFGDIDEFEGRVNVTHAENEQYRREYLETIKYVKAIL